MSSEVLCNLDALRNSLKRAVSAVSVIQSAIECDILADENEASEALFFVWEKLYDISKQISEQIDIEYANRGMRV
ncbi:MAG: hypothetical protein ACI3W5_03535 [Faecousia sp.]